MAKDLKAFHEAGGLHLDIHFGNVLVHPESGLRLADFDGAVFRDDIHNCIMDFGAVDAETEAFWCESEDALRQHLQDNGQAIDEFMFLKTIAESMGEEDVAAAIDTLNIYAHKERQGEELDQSEADEQAEAMEVFSAWVQTVAKPGHVEDVGSLVLDPVGFRRKNGDRLHLCDMLDLTRSP